MKQDLQFRDNDLQVLINNKLDDLIKDVKVLSRSDIKNKLINFKNLINKY